MSDETKGPFDWFELCVAVLLGACAVGAALAGYQNNQWGGQQLEAYTLANGALTEAAKAYNQAVSDMNHDYAAVAQAKRSILDAIYEQSAAAEERDRQVASYFLNEQITPNARKALGLPDKAAPATPDPAATEDPDAGTTSFNDLEKKLAGNMMEIEDLITAFNTEFDSSYVEGMLAEATQGYADAEETFTTGRTANQHGDEFDVVQVIFTVALFFAGIALVFKTRIRWAFFGAGALTFALAVVEMSSLPRAGAETPTEQSEAQTE